MQWKIAKNKRQDDLFNLRYKLYEKIIDFIIKVKTDFSKHDDEESIKTVKNWSNDKYLPLAENIIFESENLFGVDIANHLKNYLKNLFWILLMKEKQMISLGVRQ